MSARLLSCLAVPILLANAGQEAGRPGTPSTFAPCTSAPRVTCVVDGDTFWLDGTKVRVADINTPETHRPACAAERALGEQATRRFTQLLNAGPFQLEAAGARDTDRFGRKLRVVTRGGQSLGMVLVEEGLAEPWQGRRANRWCASA
ncbi:thermonuclease family protein [Paraurantiacibacter namhicola]|uniref:Endonuclease YncB n=1 Tax=Paraurantiacibacter namhicola TaxID=645517 RepID=A0A1C7D6C8_9SPHN|nr:thermonuclease family protein [Paraurantiacibacter namhicola]ANU07017.1 Endonuclease YncB precursor [Paraurantiacibacter namhicola]